MPNNLQNEEVTFKSGKRLCTYIIHIYNLGSNPGSDRLLTATNRSKDQPLLCLTSLFNGRFQRVVAEQQLRKVTTLQRSLRSHNWAFVPLDSGKMGMLISTSNPGSARESRRDSSDDCIRGFKLLLSPWCSWPGEPSQYVLLVVRVYQSSIHTGPGGMVITWASCAFSGHQLPLTRGSMALSLISGGLLGWSDSRSYL